MYTHKYSGVSHHLLLRGKRKNIIERKIWVGPFQINLNQDVQTISGHIPKQLDILWQQRTVGVCAHVSLYSGVSNYMLNARKI